MSDLSLVERLRFYGETYPYQAEAADRIEQLEEALRTIAKAGGFITRTTGELVCRADVTREIARAVITAQGIRVETQHRLRLHRQTRARSAKPMRPKPVQESSMTPPSSTPCREGNEAGVLEPCPFCGCPVNRVYAKRDMIWIEHHTEEELLCPIADGIWATEDQWNTRTQPPPLSDEGD